MASADVDVRANVASALASFSEAGADDSRPETSRTHNASQPASVDGETGLFFESVTATDRYIGVSDEEFDEDDDDGSEVSEDQADVGGESDSFSGEDSNGGTEGASGAARRSGSPPPGQELPPRLRAPATAGGAPLQTHRLSSELSYSREVSEAALALSRGRGDSDATATACLFSFTGPDVDSSSNVAPEDAAVGGFFHLGSSPSRRRVIASSSSLRFPGPPNNEPRGGRDQSDRRAPPAPFQDDAAVDVDGHAAGRRGRARNGRVRRPPPWMEDHVQVLLSSEDAGVAGASRSKVQLAAAPGPPVPSQQRRVRWQARGQPASGTSGVALSLLPPAGRAAPAAAVASLLPPGERAMQLAERVVHSRGGEGSRGSVGEALDVGIAAGAAAAAAPAVAGFDDGAGGELLSRPLRTGQRSSGQKRRRPAALPVDESAASAGSVLGPVGDPGFAPGTASLSGVSAPHGEERPSRDEGAALALAEDGTAMGPAAAAASAAAPSPRDAVVGHPGGASASAVGDAAALPPARVGGARAGRSRRPRPSLPLDSDFIDGGDSSDGGAAAAGLPSSEARGAAGGARSGSARPHKSRPSRGDRGHVAVHAPGPQSLHAQKRPWTAAEDDALRAALASVVKGE